MIPGAEDSRLAIHKVRSIMQIRIRSDARSLGAHHLFTLSFLAIACMACAACGGPWTARICSSNPSGNCRGVSPFPDHYSAKSVNAAPVVNGITDVQVRDPACPNGIGSVDVTVLDRNDLDIAVYCLSDSPAPSGGTMTLPTAASAHLAVPTSAPSH